MMRGDFPRGPKLRNPKFYDLRKVDVEGVSGSRGGPVLSDPFDVLSGHRYSGLGSRAALSGEASSIVG